MSLLDIKKHMMQVKIATLTNLCAIFKVQPDMMRDLLSHWMKKGRITCCKKTSNCGSKCFKCPSNDIEIYTWVDGAASPALGVVT